MNATAARHLLKGALVKTKSIVGKMSTFHGVKDLFGGIIVRSNQEPHERSKMEQLLKGILIAQDFILNKIFHIRIINRISASLDLQWCEGCVV